MPFFKIASFKRKSGICYCSGPFLACKIKYRNVASIQDFLLCGEKRKVAIIDIGGRKGGNEPKLD
jgi:hypothetical protein